MTTNQPATAELGIPIGLISEHDLREQWDRQRGDAKYWTDLSFAEQLAWAQIRAIAADRAKRVTPPADGEVRELATLRQQQAAPVPVSERLPDTSDPSECRMPDGDCWWFDPHQDGAWYMDTFQIYYTHWLPANAIPAPLEERHHG